MRKGTFCPRGQCSRAVNSGGLKTRGKPNVAKTPEPPLRLVKGHMSYECALVVQMFEILFHTMTLVALISETVAFLALKVLTCYYLMANASMDWYAEYQERWLGDEVQPNVQLRGPKHVANVPLTQNEIQVTTVHPQTYPFGKTGTEPPSMIVEEQATWPEKEDLETIGLLKAKQQQHKKSAPMSPSMESVLTEEKIRNLVDDPAVAKLVPEYPNRTPNIAPTVLRSYRLLLAIKQVLYGRTDHVLTAHAEFAHLMSEDAKQQKLYLETLSICDRAIALIEAICQENIRDFNKQQLERVASKNSRIFKRHSSLRRKVKSKLNSEVPDNNLTWETILEAYESLCQRASSGRLMEASEHAQAYTKAKEKLEQINYLLHDINFEEDTRSNRLIQERTITTLCMLQCDEKTLKHKMGIVQALSRQVDYIKSIVNTALVEINQLLGIDVSLEVVSHGEQPACRAPSDYQPQIPPLASQVRNNNPIVLPPSTRQSISEFKSIPKSTPPRMSVSDWTEWTSPPPDFSWLERLDLLWWELNEKISERMKHMSKKWIRNEDKWEHVIDLLRRIPQVFAMSTRSGFDNQQVKELNCVCGLTGNEHDASSECFTCYRCGVLQHIDCLPTARAAIAKIEAASEKKSVLCSWCYTAKTSVVEANRDPNEAKFQFLCASDSSYLLKFIGSRDFCERSRLVETFPTTQETSQPVEETTSLGAKANAPRRMKFNCICGAVGDELDYSLPCFTCARCRLGQHIKCQPIKHSSIQLKSESGITTKAPLCTWCAQALEPRPADAAQKWTTV